MKYNAEYLVKKLDMNPHPEGGWYKETYRSDETISSQALPVRFTGARSYSTGIYFLLEQKQFSGFHRIKSDEMWHFYAGTPLNVFVIDPDGHLDIIKLGTDMEQGQRFQAVVGAGNWFASQPAFDANDYEGIGVFSLVGCTVAPGFDFNDFEMAQQHELLKEFPQHAELIRQYCRE